MIKTEILNTGLIHTWSNNEAKLIREIHSGCVFQEAVDNPTWGCIYEEVDKDNEEMEVNHG